MCDGQGRSPYSAHFLLKKSILHINSVKYLIAYISASLGSDDLFIKKPRQRGATDGEGGHCVQWGKLHALTKDILHAVCQPHA